MFPHKFIHYVQEYGPRILLSLVVLVLFYLGATWAGALIRKLGARTKAHQVIADLIAQLVKTTFVIVGLICALATLGIDVTGLLATLGLLGFAVGFALKDVLSNALSGILILYYRPFWIEDEIKVLGHQGKITDIDLRYLTLQTENGIVLIPSSSLLNNSVEILEKKAENVVKPTISANEAESKESAISDKKS